MYFIKKIAHFTKIYYKNHKFKNLRERQMIGPIRMKLKIKWKDKRKLKNSKLS